MGEKTEVGESHTHKFRVAEPGGYFSFTMKVVPDFSYLLVATYWGMDNRGRQFDILVDGEKVGSEDLNKYKESKFYDITYRIPTSLTNGKTKITVKFQPKEKNSAGPGVWSEVSEGICCQQIGSSNERRDFLKTSGLATAAAVITPFG